MEKEINPVLLLQMRNNRFVKLYCGLRWGEEDRIQVRVADAAKGLVYDLRHVLFHSDGFEWGYAGSGPADLALSILADWFGENPTKEQVRSGECKCWRFHQDFKWKLIANAPRAQFVICANQYGTFTREDDPSRIIAIKKETSQ